MPIVLMCSGVSGVRVLRLVFWRGMSVLVVGSLLVSRLFLAGVPCKSGGAILVAGLLVALLPVRAGSIGSVMGMRLMWRRLSPLSTPPLLLYCFSGTVCRVAFPREGGLLCAVGGSPFVTRALRALALL